MKYQGVCIAVKDVNLSKKFYQDLFGLEVFQDYGICIGFSCGLSLQQDFDKIMGVAKESIVERSHNMQLYFEEDDFDGFIQKLMGYPHLKYLRKLHELPWGQRSIKFYDLDEHLIEVAENLGFVVKRFLESGMTLEETSKRMDVSVPDLEKLLNN